MRLLSRLLGALLLVLTLTPNSQAVDGEFAMDPLDVQAQIVLSATKSDPVVVLTLRNRSDRPLQHLSIELFNKDGDTNNVQGPATRPDATFSQLFPGQDWTTRIPIPQTADTPSLLIHYADERGHENFIGRGLPVPPPEGWVKTEEPWIGPAMALIGVIVGTALTYCGQKFRAFRQHRKDDEKALRTFRDAINNGDVSASAIREAIAQLESDAPKFAGNIIKDAKALIMGLNVDQVPKKEKKASFDELINAINRRL